MPPGRPRKRLAVKIAEGLDRARDYIEEVPDIGGRPANPFDPERIAHKAFEQIVSEVEQLGTLGSIDLSHLVIYAEAWEVRENAAEILRKDGYIAFGKEGPKAHPANTIWKQASTLLRSVGNDLGTNANARARIKPAESKPKVDERKRFIG